MWEKYINEESRKKNCLNNIGRYAYENLSKPFDYGPGLTIFLYSVITQFTKNFPCGRFLMKVANYKCIAEIIFQKAVRTELIETAAGRYILTSKTNGKC